MYYYYSPTLFLKLFEFVPPSPLVRIRIFCRKNTRHSVAISIFNTQHIRKKGGRYRTKSQRRFDDSKTDVRRVGGFVFFRFSPLLGAPFIRWVNPDAGPRPVGQGIHVRKKSAQGSHRAGFDNRGTYRCSLPLSSDRFDLVRLRNGRHRYRFYVISYAITYSDTLVRLPQEVSSVAGVSLFLCSPFFSGDHPQTAIAR